MLVYQRVTGMALFTDVAGKSIGHPHGWRSLPWWTRCANGEPSFSSAALLEWNGRINRLNSANQGRIRKILRKIYLGAQLITISHDITRYYNILLRIMHRATGPTIGLHPRETFEIKDSVTCGKIPRDEKNSPKISSIKDYNSTMNSTWWFHNIYIYIIIYHNTTDSFR